MGYCFQNSDMGIGVGAGDCAISTPPTNNKNIITAAIFIRNLCKRS
jgi:hypothetical protein